MPRVVKLPLFPLQVVLFPGSRLPLHIFEERYKVLIGECRKTGVPFGITLAQEGAVAFTGCTAILQKVIRTYADGKMDIVVEGGRRFTLHAVDDLSAPYLVGKVSYRNDKEEKIDLNLLGRTAGLFRKFAGMVFPDSDFGARNLDSAFLMAQKAGLDLSLRQVLLEMDSENDRLRFLEKHFVEIIPHLQKAGEVERIARNDGYI